MLYYNNTNMPIPLLLIKTKGTMLAPVYVEKRYEISAVLPAAGHHGPGRRPSIEPVGELHAQRQPAGLRRPAGQRLQRGDGRQHHVFARFRSDRPALLGSDQQPLRATDVLYRAGLGRRGVVGYTRRVGWTTINRFSSSGAASAKF